MALLKGSANLDGIAIRSATDWYTQYLESSFFEHSNDLLVPLLKGFSGHVQWPGNHATIQGKWHEKHEKFEVIYSFLFHLANLLMDPHGRTLRNIAASLRSLGIFEATARPSLEYQLLIMAIGWLTMTAPRLLQSSEDARGISIEPEELVRLHDQSISQVLRRFELFVLSIDPPPIYDTYGEPPTQQFLAKTISFRSLTIDGAVKIVWTDQLPQHLKFDPTLRILTLFALPSFAYMLHGRTSILSQLMDDLRTTYDGGRITNSPSSFNAENIFREVLLSYRLLFGIDNSWRAFNRLDRNNIQTDMQSDLPPDPLLNMLCGRKWTSSLPKAIYQEIDAGLLSNTYGLEFPLFGPRLHQLHTFIQRQSPHTFRALWNDRRDTLRWWTFWTITFVGGMTLFIGILQIVLAIWQIVLAKQQLSFASASSSDS